MNREINNKRILKSVVIALIIVFTVTAVFTPTEVNAASKKAKAKYSVKVTNINSNTVLKKGAKLKVQYVATKKKGGVVSGAKVKFKSSNKKVASISKKGVIKAKKKGTTYITVYCKAKPSKKKKVKVRVGTPVSSISVSGFTYLGKGRSNTLKAKANSGATNKSVSWSSDNTSVVMFGDHQPRLSDEFYSAMRGSREDVSDIQWSDLKHQVPFMIWANYDINEEENVHISANYLSPLMKTVIGLPMTGFDKYLMDMCKQLPVVNAICYNDAEGKIYNPDDTSEYDGKLNEYSILQYNGLIDNKKRDEEFFELR